MNKRIVIVKEGKKYYGEFYEDKEQQLISGYLDITMKDINEFSKAIKEFGFYRYEYDRWYVEKVQ